MNGPAVLKARSNRAHARRRAAERYGLNLTLEGISQIEGMIRLGGPPDRCRPLRITKGNVDRILYVIRIEDHGPWLPVVYDRATASLISFLPIEALDSYVEVLDPLAAPRVEVGLHGLPCEPTDPGPSASVADFKEAIELLNERRSEASLRLGRSRGADKRRLHEEIERLNELGRDWKLRKQDAYHREQDDQKAARLRKADQHLRELAELGGIRDADDPVALLEAARAVFHAIGHRIGWAFTKEERSIEWAIQTYLEKHSTGAPGESGS